SPPTTHHSPSTNWSCPSKPNQLHIPRSRLHVQPPLSITQLARDVILGPALHFQRELGLDPAAAGIEIHHRAEALGYSQRNVTGAGVHAQGRDIGGQLRIDVAAP